VTPMLLPRRSVGGPRNNMWGGWSDLLIATRAAVRLRGTRARYPAHMPITIGVLFNTLKSTTDWLGLLGRGTTIATSHGGVRGPV